MQFSAEQQEIWATLYQRQLERVQRYACREYLEGFERLNLPSDHIPSLGSLNRKIHPATGWKTVRTAVRYTEAVPWYQAVRSGRCSAARISTKPGEKLSKR